MAPVSRSLLAIVSVAWISLGCSGTPEHSHSPAHSVAHGESSHGVAAHGVAAHGAGSGADDHATVHHRFEDAEHWAARFEDPSRDAWQRPDEVLTALRLTPTSRVADIGSATGYFPIRIARAVPEGVVYGLDIEPTLVNYLNLRARREGLQNLVSLVCAADDPRIPEAVDRILVSDTYHHIGSRIEYFRRLRSTLRPGGRLVIVDFKKGDFPVGPKDDHKLSADHVIDELGQSGFLLVERRELPYQYVLVFR